MNPLANEQLGQATHREYEAKYGRNFSPKEKENTQETFPNWQKLALVTGSVAAVIVLVSYYFVG